MTVEEYPDRACSDCPIMEFVSRFNLDHAAEDDIHSIGTEYAKSFRSLQGGNEALAKIVLRGQEAITVTEPAQAAYLCGLRIAAGECDRRVVLGGTVVGMPTLN